jgi:hypothetical protein
MPKQFKLRTCECLIPTAKLQRFEKLYLVNFVFEFCPKMWRFARRRFCLSCQNRDLKHTKCFEMLFAFKIWLALLLLAVVAISCHRFALVDP